MSDTQKVFTLTCQSRETSREANESLKTENKIPAVVYGKDFSNLNISVKLADFERVYAEAKKSSFIDLTIDEKDTIKVLCYDFQADYTGKIIHADFYKVNENEELTVEVSLNFVNEAPAKKLGYNVLLQTETIKVKCLPKDLVSSIDVDLSGLSELEQTIKISDLVLPAGITVLNHADEIVAVVKEAVEIDTKLDNTDENVASQQAAEAAEKEAAAEEKATEEKTEEAK